MIGIASGDESNALAADAEIGTLTCKLTDVTKPIVYSNEKFLCEFAPREGAPKLYTGEIKSIGVNLSIKNEMDIVWLVLAPSSGILRFRVRGSPESGGDPGCMWP